MADFDLVIEGITRECSRPTEEQLVNINHEVDSRLGGILGPEHLAKLKGAIAKVAHHIHPDGQVMGFGCHHDGMGQLKAVMAGLKMVYASEPNPDVPPVIDTDVLDAYVTGTLCDPDGSLEMEVITFYTKWSDFLAWAPPGRVGIPSHKLSSCDHWLVTPAECVDATKLAHMAMLDNPASVARLVDLFQVPHEVWGQWLLFLERAASHGGFRTD